MTEYTTTIQYNGPIGSYSIGNLTLLHQIQMHKEANVLDHQINHLQKFPYFICQCFQHKWWKCECNDETANELCKRNVLLGNIAYSLFLENDMTKTGLKSIKKNIKPLLQNNELQFE